MKPNPDSYREVFVLYGKSFFDGIAAATLLKNDKTGAQNVIFVGKRKGLKEFTTKIGLLIKDYPLSLPKLDKK